MASKSHSSTVSLGPLSKEMKGAGFADPRITKRAVTLLRHLAKSPQSSINASMPDAASTAAAYRFFNNPKVTPDRILSAHRSESLQRAAGHSSIRLVQDTSETDFSSLATLKGSGPLSNKERRGAFLHTQLLVAPGGLPLGVHDHQFIVRKDEEHGKAARSKQRPIEQKESYRWIEGFRKACHIQRELPDTEVISVADREADIYELFVEHQRLNEASEQVADFVVRAKENRVLLGDHENETLFELDQKGKPLGVIEFEVPAQRQRKGTSGNSTEIKIP